MTNWRQRARCRGLDPELFFPGLGESTAEAKAVCAGCPVRMPCLDYALDTSERHGVYGGLSERERRKIRRRRLAERRAEQLTHTASIDRSQLATSEGRRATVHHLHRGGMTAADIARVTGIAETTVWRLLRRAA